MLASVVIPVYNALPFTKECVASIYTAGADLNFELIVVNNGSSPEVQEWLQAEERNRANLRSLQFPEPLGFSGAVNAGASAATGDVLIVLNSDTIVTEGWMDGLCAALAADPSLGAVTPCTNQAGEPAQIDHRVSDLGKTKALAFMLEKPNPQNVLYLPQRLTFFCVALRRAVWTELGGLDECYRVGNFEDDDLCLRLRLAGYRLGVAQNVFVYHQGRASFDGNDISHHRWMAHNAAVFCSRARDCAEAAAPPAWRWPRRSLSDVSVVIHPKAGGSLDRTLRSLDNQTVRDFEIVLPDSDLPTRPWIAHITQGDVLYPFHLEALLDAMERNCAEAIFSDGWIAGCAEPPSHPDTPRLTSTSVFPSPAPRLLAGWMHHQSLDPERLWEQTTPSRWPRLTWEMQDAPPPPPTEVPPPSRSPSLLERAVLDPARSFYRRSVRYETRLLIDQRVRSLLDLPPLVPIEISHAELRQRQLKELTTHLETLVEARSDAGKFAMGTTLPAVFLFNIIPWNAAVQRPHHFARGLARRGYPVFWIETGLAPGRNWWTGRPFPQVGPAIHLVRLPGSTRDIYHLPWDAVVLDAMSAALRQVSAAYGLRQTVSLVNFPHWQPLVMRAKAQWGWNVVYDCLDDQRAFADLYQTRLEDHEDILIDAADLLITSSAVLQQRMSQRRSSLLLHNAADYDLFSAAVPNGSSRHLSRPVIGFFGALADWLDTHLIRAAAAQFPDWSFVYIGPPSFSNAGAETRWLRSTDLPNITVLPQMDPQTLAAHLAEFDVCIMPFLDVPVTRTMNAVKVYEYLAAGKPVISRDLPEVRLIVDGEPDHGDLLALYSTPEEFFQQLKAAVGQMANSGESSRLAARRRNFARHHDWPARVDVLAQAINSISASSSGSNT